MYAPPEGKSARVARRPVPAGSKAPDSESLLGARAASLNASPRIRQLKDQEESLGGRPEIRSLAEAKKAPNSTGLPDNLKAGVESLSGVALDDVRVHYGSSKPAALQAKAFAQGSEIHVAPGEEKHLPHEAWHVVQQKQGRVKATRQLKSVSINDDGALEREADWMGALALAAGKTPSSGEPRGAVIASSQAVLQGFQLRQLDESRHGISDLHFRYDDDIAGGAQAGEHLHITVSYSAAAAGGGAAAAVPVTRHCYYNYTTSAWRWDTAPTANVQQVAEAQQAEAINWAKAHRPAPVVPAAAPAAAPAGPRPKMGKMPRKGAAGTTTVKL